jgi:hypothetical protein
MIGQQPKPIPLSKSSVHVMRKESRICKFTHSDLIVPYGIVCVLKFSFSATTKSLKWH